MSSMTRFDFRTSKQYCDKIRIRTTQPRGLLQLNGHNVQSKGSKAKMIFVMMVKVNHTAVVMVNQQLNFIGPSHI